jgi:hypothetical protein
MRYLLGLALVLSGCALKNDGRYCDASRQCNDPAFPNCDQVKHECEAGGIPDGGSDDGGADLAVITCTDSSSCPASDPVCAMTSCGPCTSGDNSDCASFHPTTPLCGPSGGCVECLANMDCFSKAATPFCGPSNSCVECLTAANCTPKVCSATNTCRGCQTNAECPSGICDTPSGNCVDPSMISLVDNGGMTVVACDAGRTTKNGQTPATAYCDIADAGAVRPYILVTGHGAAFPYGPFSVNAVATYVGPGYKAAMPAVVTGTTTAGGIVTMNLTAISSVTIDGFEINGGNAKDGIDCTSTKSTAPHAVLNVKNSYIHNTAGNAGISPTGCDLNVDSTRVAAASIRDIDDTGSTFVTSTTLTNSEFDSGSADGVDSGAILTMDRCIITNNSGGNGLQINGPNFAVTNSFFYNNNQAVEFVVAAAPTSVFLFNTVVYNTRGFSCATTTIQASIYVHNGDGPLVSAVGSCKTIDVVTDSVGAPQPVFVDTSSVATYDFRLAVDTPAHLTANQACCIDQVKGPLDGGTSPLPGHDFFGTMRPLGAGSDIGAHEAK